MTKEHIQKFISYSMGLIISTISIYFVLNILYENNIIGRFTANLLSLVIYGMPFLLALYLAGMSKDTLELMRMKRRFKFSVKAALLAAFMGILALTAGFLIVKEYTDLTLKNYLLGLGYTLQNTWYTAIIGAVSLEAGFRGFLKSHFEKTYSAFGSSLMIGIVYSVWLTIFIFLSENPSFLCLLAVAIQFILLSVFLGIATSLCRKNLYPAIAFHFVWNTVAYTMNFQNRIEFLVYSNLFLLFLCGISMIFYSIKKRKKG